MSQPHLNIIFLSFGNRFSLRSPFRDPLVYYLMC